MSDRLSPSPAPRTGRREITGLVLFFAAVSLLLCLFSYRPFDISAIQSPPNHPTANIIGPLGAWSAYLLFMSLGLAGYAVPLLMAAQAGLCLMGQQFNPEMRINQKLGWMILLLVCMACLMELLHDPLKGSVDDLNIPFAGGALGHLLGAMVLIRLMGNTGAAILLGMVAMIGAVFLFDFEVARLFRDPQGTVGPWLRKLRDMFKASPEREGELPLEEDEVPKKKRKTRKESAETQAALATVGVEQDIFFPAPEVDDPVLPSPPEEDEDFGEDAGVFVEPEPEPPVPSIFKTPAGTPAAKPAAKPEDADIEALLPDPSADALAGVARLWTLPPIDLLQAAKPVAATDGKREEFLRQLLETTLKEFGVEAKITDVQRGPVVTSFEVLPAPGVRVEKISSLSNNLALALKAESIRVQAPIPGKGVVGIEVPNGGKTTVVMAREIIDSPEWEKSKDWRKGKIALPLCFGVDVSGRKLVGDLADMPHMLIAGATGSGKSVCMNSLLAGLLMSRTPDQLRLILVDPKIVEFTAYRDLPHLVVPVITDAKKVGIGLRWAITEMEKRYKLFARVGVRNIKGYNNRVVAKQGDLFGGANEKDEHPETLPYIVIVIDELADLMMVAQAEVENYIARLAQLSRAVGIHMILATQRPSVNVITGTIKANFPARIAFQVAQKTDSRTILDAIGADKLLGKGDMLFLSPSSSKLLRAQGAWTSDEEINDIVAFIKDQGSPDYESQIAEKLESKAMELPDQEEDDDLVEQAIEVIRQTQRASTSSLQRRLRIGYNRAARLMDQLEEKGVIGPPKGADPREILIDLEGEIPQNAPDAGGEE